MFRLIRRIVSLPVQWLGQLLSMFQPAAGMPVLRLAYEIGADGEVGVATLVAVQRQFGPQAARLQAQAWMQRQPTAQIAVYLGLLAVDEGDVAFAQQCLDQANQLGKVRSGMAEVLEFTIAGMRSGRQDTSLAHQWESRSDLPPALSKLIREGLMWDDLLHRRLAQAALRAKRLADIESNGQAEMVLWACAMAKGDRASAQRHYGRAAMPQAQKTYYRTVTSPCTGEDADQLLEQLREMDEGLAARAQQFLAHQEARS